MRDLWIVEKRHEDGSLDFSEPQPERFFGLAAIHGMSDDAMAKVIFRHVPLDVALEGMNIPRWPAHLDPRFVARRKTW